MTTAISLTKLRELQLREPPQAQRPSHVSAASGLVCIHDRLYVVADDELHLAEFSASTDAPGELIRMLPGELPVLHTERKRAKPDFETLVRLPPLDACPNGAVLAIGSGSTAVRHRAVLLPLGEHEELIGSSQVVDVRPFHDAVAEIFGVPNIEGALVSADRLLLFQRGNKGAGVNAIVAFALRDLAAALLGNATPLVPVDAQRYELGSIREVPLGFSDATLLADGTIVFAAIAEDTDDAYADGPCAGAAIGSIDASGSLQRVVTTSEPAKIEGICVVAEQDSAKLLLVTDADDSAVPASLYRATWPR